MAEYMTRVMRYGTAVVSKSAYFKDACFANMVHDYSASNMVKYIANFDSVVELRMHLDLRFHSTWDVDPMLFTRKIEDIKAELCDLWRKRHEEDDEPREGT